MRCRRSLPDPFRPDWAAQPTAGVRSAMVSERRLSVRQRTGRLRSPTRRTSPRPRPPLCSPGRGASRRGRSPAGRRRHIAGTRRRTHAAAAARSPGASCVSLYPASGAANPTVVRLTEPQQGCCALRESTMQLVQHRSPSTSAAGRIVAWERRRSGRGRERRSQREGVPMQEPLAAFVPIAKLPPLGSQVSHQTGSDSFRLPAAAVRNRRRARARREIRRALRPRAPRCP